MPVTFALSRVEQLSQLFGKLSLPCWLNNWDNCSTLEKLELDTPTVLVHVLNLNSMIRLTLALTLVLLTIAPTIACPFCSAVSQTLRQEIGIMDAVVIAESTRDSIRDELTGQVQFKIISVLKGDKLVKPDQTVSSVYYGTVAPGRRFMLSGAEPADLQWACLPLTEASEQYLGELTKLPDDPLERLKFYQPYLQHPDSMLNRDAYDEFAITPYSVVQTLKPFMDHDQLVSWINEDGMPADRKRLYLTMLGVCGDEKDLPLLEEMLTSTQPTSRGGLDALIACYLMLAGEAGLPKIDELFLNNAKAPYADTYAAIMAVRFHGTEATKIPRSALVNSLHYVLERKDIADLVIPDLARWGDWSQIDRLVELFVEAEKDNNWIRVPVVNYLRACPKPEAEEAIKKLKEIDPESVKRAGSVFSIPAPQPAPAASSSHAVPKHKDLLGVSSSLSLARTSSGPLAAVSSAPHTEHWFAISRGMKTPIAAPWLDLNRFAATGVAVFGFGLLLALLYLVLCFSFKNCRTVVPNRLGTDPLRLSEI